MVAYFSARIVPRTPQEDQRGAHMNSLFGIGLSTVGIGVIVIGIGFLAPLLLVVGQLPGSGIGQLGSLAFPGIGLIIIGAGLVMMGRGLRRSS